MEATKRGERAYMKQGKQGEESCAITSRGEKARLRFFFFKSNTRKAKDLTGEYMHPLRR